MKQSETLPISRGIESATSGRNRGMRRALRTHGASGAL